MRRVFRPLAVFSIASGVSLAVALQLLVGGARGHDGPGDFGTSAFFPGYDLAKLDLVDPTLYHISESYVDQSRLDWDAMFNAALDAIEHDVPVCMFTREPGGDLLSVEIGEYRTVLEVPPIRRRQELQSELRRVAELLATHLDEDDLPEAPGAPAPMAQIEYALINGMLSTLDPHSVLLPPDDAREMDVENQGEFGGLGITISMDADGGRLIVDYPLKDTPAHAAGLQSDDHIVRIDGESTINMSLDDAVRRLRGPVGAPVVVEVMRPGVPEPIQFRVQRELISINPVEDELVDGTDIGYVSIKGFHEKVEQKLHEALARLHREAGGALDGLILDLRGNPGGFLNQAVKVADTFLDSGDIVSTVDGEGRRTDIDKARKASEPHYPIAVLVDANSASASEIVAGALRFNERAVIIGERTFGKGSVQNLHPFSDNSKLKLTISKYLTPGDRSIQAVGIPADIELLTSIVPPRAEPGALQSPIRLFYRERVRREADLDHSLEQTTVRFDDPTYRVRYVDVQRERRRTDALDLRSDFQVRLARDVLKASEGWRRADVLSSAHPVVERYRKIGNDQLLEAFSAYGIDWARGPVVPVGDDPLEVHLDLGPDGRLVAGEAEQIAVEVTNLTDQTLYRVAAIVSESEVLSGREFFFGRLEPGETRRYEQRVRLPAGWPAEEGSLSLELRDASEQAISRWTGRLVVAGRPLPSLAWRWEVLDDGGDSDGLLDVGERLRIQLEVQNHGEGPTSEPFARLRNRSGKSMDLVVGTLEPGALQRADGSPCPAGEEPDCERILEPGASWSGDFLVDVRALPTDGEPLRLELTLGDSAAYDHGSVVRAGFHGWFSQHDTLVLHEGQQLPSSDLRIPPVVSITRSPPPYSDSSRITLSGVVTDDVGVSNVMIFAGDNKVFFEGSGPTSALRSLPFTADVELQDGSNVLTVLATDADGFVSSRSVLSWFDGIGLAQLHPLDPADPAGSGER
ncbi:MAG TPA: PDZ domain-containing protein [Deltaproteobacteria bacterium]|nr:PDZ domain-containing protein [Deltaproteobacteria bacterium]